MPNQIITTEAVARRETLPDLARVEVTAVGEGENTRDALALASDRASTIRESVTTVSNEQIRTVDIQVEDSSEAFVTPETDAQYVGKERLIIECIPDTAEAVVMEVTDAGGTVQTVDFYLHEDVRRRLQNEALSAAMERAREKAERMAAAEGLIISEVREATTSEASSGMQSIVDEALERGHETNLAPTPVTVTESVEVVYELTTE